jgi:hypothetical protein
MAELRVVQVKVISSTSIEATFTEKLTPTLTIANVSIVTNLASVPNPAVLKVSVAGNILTITTQPLTPQASYFITFQSVPSSVFKSLNGDAILFMDGITNVVMILGPADANDPVLNFLINYLGDQVYDGVYDPASTIYKLLQTYASVMGKALYDARQLKNENYLSYTVVDERKIRGSGAFDRLVEEGAYEIDRVGINPTGANSVLTIPFSAFPNNPVSLLGVVATELVTLASDNTASTFNIDTFILTVQKSPVTILQSVVFTYTDGRLPYTYPINLHGYRIFNSLYDQSFGSSFAQLGTNQFGLSQSILTDPAFSLNNIFQITVQYQYKDLGRVINTATTTLTTVKTAAREVLPPIENVFNLQHAPIVDVNGNLETLGGLTFINLNAINPNTPHPAFLYEVPFNLASLPARPGEYSVDYSTGTVYVYGADTTSNGTGPTPPIASYNYTFTYQNNLDYAYDTTANDIAPIPTGNLLNNPATITFNYEQVLIPGVDYQADVHVEALSESIANRLVALNAIQTLNGPITNVFRIFNQTSGEVYNLLRWFNNTVYFTYNIPPNVTQLTHEQVSFQDSINELLFVNQVLTNSSNVTVFKLLLGHNNLTNASADGIGASINSSVRFSNATIFQTELWFDANETETLNINRLTQTGLYQVDYLNGIVYVAVAGNQSRSVGTISYKNSNIVPQNPHLISVDDIYNRISLTSPKNKSFDYINFGDGFILPTQLDPSDEAFLNKSITAPYQVDNNQIGVFSTNATFVPGVTNPISFLRGIYEFADLKSNSIPVNFAPSATFSGQIITVAPLTTQQYTNVAFDGTNFYVLSNLDLPFLSSNITLSITITRLSDNKSLWNGSGTVILGSPVKFVLPGINSPQAGDAVSLTYTLSINPLSRVIVDYNKGDLFIDYTYLADEIQISYEYGDNVIDFRQSLSVSPGDIYYTTYKVGALRDALIKNFGSMINVPALSSVDITLPRERYRDALTGALSSFLQGPTTTAITNLVEQISHVKPELIESIFQNWSLGSSLLNPELIHTTGELQLLPAKFDNGVLINQPGQTITFPVSSNLRLEQGSFQTWVSPHWNGLDNDANLTITVFKNGELLPSDQIFLGAREDHPIYDATGSFTTNKQKEIIGIPNRNKDGVYLYYAPDVSTLFNRWYLEVVDGYSDGYQDGYNTIYNIQISTDGRLYDLRPVVSPQPSNLRITSGLKNASLVFTGVIPEDTTITFLADFDHYILDFGTAPNQNRLSIYKDVSGFLNFRTYDKQKRAASISADVSKWRANDWHHVACSWKLNSKIGQDELHLFVDGFEVPNVITFGNRIGPYPHELFRTIDPEEIAGVITKTIVASTDLITTAGSSSVSSSINFTLNGINPGDTLVINEPGFAPSYTILTVLGQTLVLTTPMPLSITNGNFSVNPTSFIVQTEIDVFPNFAVSTISSSLNGSDLTTNGTTTVTAASTNFTTAGILPGYLLRIDHAGLENHYNVLAVAGNTLTLDDAVTLSLTNATYHLYPNNPVEIPGLRAVRPAYTLSKGTNFSNVLTITNDARANDLIHITTLGLNHRRIRQPYFQWGSNSNVIATALPNPVALAGVNIYHELLSNTLINSTNCVLINNNFTSNTFTTEQPSPSDTGRFLSVTIRTTNNLDFNVPVTVHITGSASETLTFTTTGTQTTTHQYSSVSGVSVSGRTLNNNRTFMTLLVEEAESILVPDNNSVLFPVIRFSYQIDAGTTLSGAGGTVVTDPNGFFASPDLTNYLIILSPAPVAGTYQISSISADRKNLTINTSLPAFSGGFYQIVNASDARSGFQNGFFFFEDGYLPGQPYLLPEGTYDFDYYTYLTVPFDPIDTLAYLGTDLNGTNLFNGIIDSLKISSVMLTDTRIGETIPSNQESITKDFNSLKPASSDINTTMLAIFNELPFTNDADFYSLTQNTGFVQAGFGVNDKFNQSLYITDQPLTLNNSGILNTRKQGTIEFWINPSFDTANDPNYRYYFDAFGATTEQTVSINDTAIQVVGSIGKVLSVKLQHGNRNVDYFDGGFVGFDTTGAIAEATTSLNVNTVMVSQPALQVLSIRITGDATGIDYFGDGTISSDGKTIFLGISLPKPSLPVIVTYKTTSAPNRTANRQVIRLGKRLPSQNTPVVVTYLPNGMQGDRLSIYKDPFGYVNFDVTASGTLYKLRGQAFWSRNTWHRVKATYSFNSGNGTDEMHFFLDGYERGNIPFGTIMFGDPHIPGATTTGIGGLKANIAFKDLFTQLSLGSDYSGQNTAYALIDNFRISDIARPLFLPFGESIDPNYNSNLSVVFPVVQDLFTTLLLDFDTLVSLNQDFAMLLKNGSFDFTLKVFDSFDIVNGNDQVKQVLEALIHILKPANSRAMIEYVPTANTA